MLELLNQERARAGLARLAWDHRLARAALPHSRLLARHGDLSHQFPGEPPLAERAGAVGAHFNSVAENVAYGPEVSEIHSGLMHSSPHRANILNPEYNSVGIAIVPRDGQLYVTEDFAHVITEYSEAQFRDTVIAAFQRIRQQHGLPRMDVRSDPRLQRAACARMLDAKKVLRGLPGATDLAIYTSSDPGTLPSNMKDAAADKTLHRMNIGVCFKPGGKDGFSKYWVVAAFYPVQ